MTFFGNGGRKEETRKTMKETGERHGRFTGNDHGRAASEGARQGHLADNHCVCHGGSALTLPLLMMMTVYREVWRKQFQFRAKFWLLS